MYYLEEFFWFYCSIFSIKVRMICRVTSAISVKLSSHQDFLSWQNTVTRRRRRRTKKRRRKTAQINLQIVQNSKCVEGLLISISCPFCMAGYFSAHEPKWYPYSKNYWPFVPNALSETKIAIYTPKRVDESPTLLDGYPLSEALLPLSVRPSDSHSVCPSYQSIINQSISQRNKHLTSQPDNELINVPFFCHTITGTWSQSFVHLICWRIILVTQKLKGCFSWLHHLILLQYLVSVHRWNENAGI